MSADWNQHPCILYHHAQDISFTMDGPSCTQMLLIALLLLQKGILQLRKEKLLLQTPLFRYLRFPLKQVNENSVNHYDYFHSTP